MDNIEASGRISILVILGVCVNLKACSLRQKLINVLRYHQIIFPKYCWMQCNFSVHACVCVRVCMCTTTSFIVGKKKKSMWYIAGEWMLGGGIDWSCYWLDTHIFWLYINTFFRSDYAIDPALAEIDAWAKRLEWKEEWLVYLPVHTPSNVSALSEQGRRQEPNWCKYLPIDLCGQ